MDIFGFKRRKIRKQLDQRFNEKKINKYIRNTERLRYWFEVKHKNGIALIQNYLEDNGMPPPKDQKECDILLDALNVESKLLAR